MASNYNKVDSLDLFNDLKRTNISFSNFKEIMSTYKKLENYYIENKQLDLLKDLNKQAKKILSYLDSFENVSIKKIAKLNEDISKNFGNIDELDTFDNQNKKASFIKVSYNNGKWTIVEDSVKDEIIFNKKEAPNAINCLVKLANKIDEQEAAYILCHAKKAGKFLFATMPFVRTDTEDTLLNTKYMKTPTTPLSPLEKPSDAVYTTNMPVSRQMASEESLDDFELSENDVLVDQDGTLLPITLVTNDYIITSQDNGIYSIDEVKQNLQSGKWKKQSALSDDAKLRKISKEIENLLPVFRQKEVLNEAAQRLINERMQAINEKLEPQLYKLQEIQDNIEPKLRKLAAKIDAITFNDQNSKRKLQKLKYLVDGMTVKYQRPIEEYRKRTVNVAQAEELMEIARKYVSKDKLKEFEENVVNKLFYFESSQEKLEVSLSDKDPRNEEMINDEIKKLRKDLKNSLNQNEDKDKAYDLLDSLLIDGTLNFNQYNDLSDIAEVNAKQVLSSIHYINSHLYKKIKSGFLQDVNKKLVSLFNSFKQWLSQTLTFLIFEEKDSNELSSKLDNIIEGE